MTERERMSAGLVYDSADPDIMKEQTGYVQYMKEFNTLGLGDEKRMEELMHLMLGSVGENCYIQPPFYANWGGAHVYFGNHVYANFGLTCVDDGNIYIGDDVLIGPNVTIATANHPVEISLRKKAFQYNRDVHIGENVWIGANTVIVPGITIGKNSVIGAGSVVCKDIPENVVAVGNPCHVVRTINQHDQEYFYKNDKIDWEYFS